MPNGNLIMVTSALPGEGKSFTAINLAMSMAMELDHHVLLVDADVAKPSLHERLWACLRARACWICCWSDRVEMSDVLLRTNVDKLTFLPSGTPHPRADRAAGQRCHDGVDRGYGPSVLRPDRHL